MNSEETRIHVKVMKTCAICKEKFEWDRNMPQNNTCYSCQHWAQTAVWDIIQQDHVIIKGEHYRMTKSSMFNFGGQIFKIRFFDERGVVETMLAHQGSIPIRFLMTKDMNGKTVPYEVFKDNAEFVQ